MSSFMRRVVNFKREIQKPLHPWIYRDFLLAFVHIPKTAGTGLVQAFRKEFCRKRCLRVDIGENLMGIEGHDFKKRYDFIHGHFGTIHTAGLATHTITVVRDPIARILSLYNYWRTQDVDFLNPKSQKPDPAIKLAKSLNFRDFVFCGEERIKNDIFNAQTFQILSHNSGQYRIKSKDTEDVVFNKVKSIVDNMTAVGRVEDLNSFQVQISDRMGREIQIPRKNVTRSVTQKYEDTPNEIIDFLRKNNSLDLKLYDYITRI